MTAARQDLYKPIVEQVCTDLSIDVKLFSAIISVESSWNPWAVRYETIVNTSHYAADKWAKLSGISEETERVLAHCSWGLGQIMTQTARSLGFEGPVVSLCDPETGATWAGLYLKRCMKRFPDRNEAIAAYNAGAPKFDSYNRFVNQAYVDRVLAFLL